ncbi:sulfatase [Prolixibacteraceae bacterium Z1-6]|uniref:Sulfatase n=1 Tax=Draconibacterium aestuarii TaxID=2998507 RepID=A0A9X3F550_9BACT|nr:sulfatase [Prolixibacteraceae bacterium Z1-6]
MNNKIIFSILVTLIFVITSYGNEKSTTKDRPNVVFILADDLGYHDLSFAGSKYYETPNIDKIADEGTVFTNGYAACQVCSPSRASIMTGKFPARHGITDWIGARTGQDWRKSGHNNKLLPAEYKLNLAAEYTTLPEALKEVGYKTFFAGKWHLGKKGSWPEDHGFDINKGGWDSGGPKGGYYAPWTNPNLESGPDGENLSTRLAKETVKFLEENKDTAFFAYLSFYAVHGPIQTTQDKWAKYRKKAEETGIVNSGYKMAARLPIRQVQDNPIYAGLVETMDDAVGLVLNSLKELGLDKNTIVIFTSDNGGVASGDAFSTSNLPLRGGKGYQFEGGIREPYIIKVPGMTNGERSDVPVSGTDFYPTILDLARADLRPNDHQDGISLLPVLKGQVVPERPLIWHYPHYGNQGGDPSSIIRLGDWKLIHYYENDKDELYNLRTDLEEQHNIAEENRLKVKELKARLFDYLESVNAIFPEKDPDFDPEKAKQRYKDMKNRRLPQLEQERMLFLSKDFEPGNNWWGSKVTKD